MNNSAQMSTIGEITTWYSGGTPSRARSDYWSGDIPWISAFTLKDAEINTSDQFLTPEAVAAGSKMAPLGSTLLLVRGSALHNVIRAGMVTSPVAFNQDVKALVPKRGIVPKYLAHVIRGNEHELLKLVTSAGNTAGVLDTKVVQTFEIYLPNEHEQRRLVEAFDDVDKLIATLERLIAKKLAIKQGMLQQLLTGKTRLSGFETPWVETRLGDTLSRPPRYGINAAAVPKTVDNDTYIRITDIDIHGRFAPSPRVGVRHPNATNYRIEAGELLFARTGASVGKSYLYNPQDGQLVYAGFLINIAPNVKVLAPEYLALYAQTAQYWDWVARISVRSGQPGINGREYAELRIQLPELREQHSIVALLKDVTSEIQLLSDRLEKAQSMKQGMMQELLTGRTRLPVLEKAS